MSRYSIEIHLSGGQVFPAGILPFGATEALTLGGGAVLGAGVLVATLG